MANLPNTNQCETVGLHAPPAKPLLVNGTKARAYLGIGATTMWKWKKAGLIETVNVAGRDMIVFASLERLAQPKAA